MATPTYRLVSVVPLDPAPAPPGAGGHWHVTYRATGEIGTRSFGVYAATLPPAAVAEAIERHLQLHPPGERP